MNTDAREFVDHPLHAARQRVAAKAGPSRTDEVVDDEELWACAPGG